MFFVYIIESEKNGRFYIGQTEDLEGRLKRHNRGGSPSTKAHIPWNLRWWKEYETRSGAFKAEQELKRIKKRIGIEHYVLKNNFRGVAQPG